jgi:hypothetical protein
MASSNEQAYIRGAIERNQQQMVSPGTLRLLTEMADGAIDECVPTIDEETGTVTYPIAAPELDASDGLPEEVLESLARRDIVERAFERKVYRCPDCDGENMTFTTACPDCDSPHTVETELLEHTECGCVEPLAAFETEGNYGEYVCPGCETALPSFDIDTKGHHRYVCRDCDERADRPAHRLRCRECLRVTEPRQAIERVCCRYSLGEAGRPWVETHLDAREAIADALRGKGFDVAVDTTVTGPAGQKRPVHVFAEDDFLGDRVVAAVGEWPDTDDVSALRTAAQGVDARAVLVTTSGSIGADAAALAADSDVAVMRPREDGTLERDVETGHAHGDRPTLIQRLTSAVRS